MQAAFPWQFVTGTALIINAILLMCAWVMFSAGSAFGSAFVAHILVTNKCEKGVFVTPIATNGVELVPLPIVMSKRDITLVSRRARFEIPSGKEIELLWDRDDVLLAALVVERDGVDPAQIRMEPPVAPRRFAIAICAEQEVVLDAAVTAALGAASKDFTSAQAHTLLKRTLIVSILSFAVLLFLHLRLRSRIRVRARFLKAGENQN